MWLIFLLTTIICGLGWYVCFLSTKALIYYMKRKGYTPPSEAETKECIRQIARTHKRPN